MIRLSIIVATYNRAPNMVRALRSLAAQDLPPQLWEAVVVDNNSTDNTRERFAEFAAAHPGLNLRIVGEPEQGLSHARNRGIAGSAGDIIAIIDDDEEVNAGFARAYLEFFDAHADAAAGGGACIPRYERPTRGDGSPLREDKSQPRHDCLPSGDKSHDCPPRKGECSSRYDCPPPRWLSPLTARPIANPLDLGPRARPFPRRRIWAGGNMAIRRSALERLGMFDPSLGRTGSKQLAGEEKELFGRLRAAGERVWWVPAARMWHIIPPERLTLACLARVSRMVGVSERVRTRGSEYVPRLFSECAKWGATAVLALWYVVTLRPAKAWGVFVLRWNITVGLLGR